MIGPQVVKSKIVPKFASEAYNSTEFGGLGGVWDTKKVLSSPAVRKTARQLIILSLESSNRFDVDPM